ncbi:MAG: gluconokinase, partial [Cupriavidus sp.]|nr:gluconokinase [Cupriavidus sp.]
FNTLEEPGDALTLDIRQSPEALVDTILQAAMRQGAGAPR